jgi:hypothetical protein
MDSDVIIMAFSGVALVFMLTSWIVGRRPGKTPEVRIKFDQYKSREHLAWVEGQR